jgi:LysR family hydrogen peroxide-inducible transcriptional activator
MKNVTLRQLRYFEALARHGHFGRAAEALAISQPALSVQIRELEAGLGAALFERGPRGVRLTGLGEEMSGRVGPILRAVEELGDLARASGQGLTGRLRLGVIPTVAPYLLPAVLRRLAVAHPTLDLRLRETMTPRLLSELQDGQIDAAILALPAGAAGLAEAEILEEPFLLVQPEQLPDLSPVGPEALDGARLLLLEEGHCFRDQALAVCGLDAGPARDGLDGSALGTLVQMVGAGLGVTMIPGMARAVETRSAAVAVRPFRAPAPTRRIGLVWRRSSPLGPRLGQLADLLREAATAVVSEPPDAASPQAGATTPEHSARGA